MGRVAILMRYCKAQILELLFPSRCLGGCGTSGVSLCERCLSMLPRAPVDHDLPDYVFPIFDYQNEAVKKVVKALKYRGNPEIVRLCARVLHEEILEQLGDAFMFGGEKKFILVPIPASGPNRRTRGFNQCELIVRELVRGDSGTICISGNRVLGKNKQTAPQTSLKKRKERIANIKGSIFVNKPLSVKNKAVILIDDVATTGATLREASRVLCEAGAKEIFAFTVAH